MSASTDPREAAIDRELERLDKMSAQEIEAELRIELAAEGKDLDVVLERLKKRILRMVRRRRVRSA